MADGGQVPFRMTPAPEDEGPSAGSRVAGPASGLIWVAALALLTNCLCGVLTPRLLRGGKAPDPPPPWLSAAEARNYERGQDAAPLLLGCVAVSATLGVYVIVLV